VPFLADISTVTLRLPPTHYGGSIYIATELALGQAGNGLK